MKRVLIHQPGKYGDYINMLPIAKKLIDLNYEVCLPHCSNTKELVKYVDGLKSFEIGLLDSSKSFEFSKQNDYIFVNCQTSPEYDYLCTTKGGKLFIEELKYYVVEDKLKFGLKYDDKFKFKWNRNLEKENQLINLLNLDIKSDYNITHLIGENGRIGIIPDEFKNHKNIHIDNINGYTLLDWYPIILKAKNVFAIQSSAQCFIDLIKNDIPHKNLFLINDTSNPDRLLVPAYNWDFKYFKNNRLI